MKIEVKVEGKVPLIMDRFAPATKETSTRAKKVYEPKDEAEKSTYRTKDNKLYLPAAHFKASMVKASTDFIMKGKKTYKDYIKAGIIIDPDEIVLDQQEYVIHEEAVVIQRARVMSWRPKIEKWSCKFQIEITDDMINQSVLKEILEAAGRFKGVGAHRPDYGRFEVKSYKVIK